MKFPPRRRGVAPYHVIGLDPSVTHFGIAHVDPKGSVRSATTIIPKKLEGMERVQFILDGVQKFMDAITFSGDPYVMVREDYAYGSHSSSDAVLKEFGGVLAWWLHNKPPKIPLYRVGVSQVKKFVTGKGNAQKDQMMLAVYKNFGYEPLDEHQADAVGVAFTALSIINGITKTTAQREVVSSATANDHPLTKLPR